MKLKVLIVLLTILFLSFNAQAIIWSPPNQSTLGWDAVTTLENGDPLPAGSQIVYNIYIKWGASGNPVLLTPTPISETQFTITFPSDMEGQVTAGVEAVRLVNGEEESRSVISWTDDINQVDPSIGDTFGWEIWFAPAQVGGLRR